MAYILFFTYFLKRYTLLLFTDIWFMHLYFQTTHRLEHLVPTHCLFSSVNSTIYLVITIKINWHLMKIAFLCLAKIMMVFKELNKTFSSCVSSFWMLSVALPICILLMKTLLLILTLRTYIIYYVYILCVSKYNIHVWCLKVSSEVKILTRYWIGYL